MSSNNDTQIKLSKKQQYRNIKNEKLELRKKYEEVKKMPPRDPNKKILFDQIKKRRKELTNSIKQIKNNKIREANDYVKFVKKYRDENKDISYIDAMKQAKELYYQSK